MNIIMTRDPDYTAQGAHVIRTVEEVLDFVKDQELMVIGGSQIYAQWMPLADRLLVTRIDADFEGETVFPETDWSVWTLTEETRGIRDDKNLYDHHFCTYIRK